MPSKIAIIFDDVKRPDTTGVYCRRALQQLAHEGQIESVDHILPQDVAELNAGQYDLFLWIDDGHEYDIPAHLKPNAFWVIDTHLKLDWSIEQAKKFDLVFVAQQDGCEQLQHAGIENAEWLALACDPDIHGKVDCPKQYDFCFIGHIGSPERARHVQRLQQHYPNHFVGNRFFHEMAETYSQSKIVFNRSIKNDINMRVFEALASGSLLLTNDLAANGLEELFQDGVHLVAYQDDELLEKFDWYLEHEEERESIAQAGRELVLSYHTYRHRMLDILGEASLLESLHGEKGEASNSQPQRFDDQESDIEEDLTSIVIVTHNQWDYTERCLDSVRKHTAEKFEFIVVDNASTDETVDSLRLHSDITLVCNDENRGFPAAVNQGLQIANGENILLLNNDVIVTSGWLERQLTLLHSKPEVGLVGPCSNNISGPQQVPATYTNVNELESFAAEWKTQHRGIADQTDRLVGFCLLFKREVMDRIGLLDEQFGIGCYEDDDFCRRAIEAGYQCLIARDAFVHHFGSRSFIGSGQDLGQILKNNRQKYLAKWSKELPANKVQTNESPRADRPVFIATATDDGLRLQENDIKLSACLIVRDNEDTIRPCLESLIPWMDETVVVDTGSKDGTPEIARELGARVFQWAWQDDFAAARNQSLRHARGEWIFWMDSDDTLPEDCGKQLRELAMGQHSEKMLGYVVQVHCPGGENGSEVTAVDHVKLIRNRPDLNFEFRIHEQIIPSIRRANGEVGWTDIFVVHSGSDRSNEGRERKLKRDFHLLELELKDRPDHPFVLFNLGMTHADADHHEKAIDYLKRCLAVSGPQESHVRKAYALLIGSQYQIEEFGEAEHYCRQGLAHFPEDKELLFRQAMLKQRFGELDEAAALYEQILNESTDRHFTSIDQGITGYKTRHNLALVYQESGRIDQAEHQWKQVLKEHPLYVPAWRAWGEMLLELAQTEQIERFIEQLDFHPEIMVESILFRAKRFEYLDEIDKCINLLRGQQDEFPDSSDLLNELCRILFIHGPVDEALASLTRLSELQPDNPAVHHNLGLKLMEDGDFESAEESLKRSLELRPGHEETHHQLKYIQTATLVAQEN